MQKRCRNNEDFERAKKRFSCRLRDIEFQVQLNHHKRRGNIEYVDNKPNTKKRTLAKMFSIGFRHLNLSWAHVPCLGKEHLNSS